MHEGWREREPDNKLFNPTKTVGNFVAVEKLGVKSGEGFYSYKK